MIARLAGRALPATIALCSFGSVALADKVRILEDPRDATQTRVDLIQQARQSIDAQYYIVGDDYYTLAGFALLRDAARRGCRVRLIIDGFSNKLPRAVHAHLAQEGVQVRIYHPIRLTKIGWLFRRMHDKGMYVDGKRMVMGGRNVEGDYFGYAHRNFIDRDIYVEGSSVGDACAYFDRLWASREVVPAKSADPSGRLAPEGEKMLDGARARLALSKLARLNTGNNLGARAMEVGRVVYLHDPVGKKRRNSGIAQALRRELLRTRRSVLLETPYLVPTKELLADIAALKQRGVQKFEILTNSISSNDSALVQLGYETSKKRLLRLGVDLWEWKGPDTLHSKSAVLDGELALIGSFNVDPRSQHLNTETAVAIRHRGTAQQLARYINAHKAQCTRITPEQPTAPETRKLPFGRRLKMSLMKAIVPLIRGQL